jgi:cytochrome c oxidase assembly protein subunit 15
MGVHGAIEFGNRLLTFVLFALAVAAVVLAVRQRPRRRYQIVLALLVAAGIPAQAVLGGITVLTGLNPWVVGLHFLLSMVVIAVAYALWRSTTAPTVAAPSAPLRALALCVLAASAAALVVGTVVTGSGPHAGDADTARTGLDPATVSQVHADLVFLLLGLSIGLWFALRAVDRPARTAAVLVGVEVAQGAIGLVQYFTGLPEVLVLAHLAGACAVWLATLAACWPLLGTGATRPR